MKLRTNYVAAERSRASELGKQAVGIHEAE